MPIGRIVRNPDSLYVGEPTDKKGNTEVKLSLCGEDCRTCDCLDKCEWGRVALERGIKPETKAEQKLKYERAKQRERGIRPERLAMAVDAIPEGMYTKRQLTERWGMSDTTLVKWLFRTGVTPDNLLKVPRGKCLNLYCEAKALRKIMKYLGERKNNEIQVRQFQRIMKKVGA